MRYQDLNPTNCSARLSLFVVLLLSRFGWADPCGMVPPIYQGEGVPIVRSGHQLTYVFFKDGIETLVIRPGFEGKVDEFGMLIPFPTPPAIRKVADNVFPHIANAIDPPEVVVHVYEPTRVRRGGAGGGPVAMMADAESGMMVKDEVRVLKEEAVGMYEVAVLQAGSSSALSRWMDEHGFKYPDGMDEVCDEYIEEEWCFVAVKTKVGVKSGADPRPGQVAANTKMPKGSSFDGHVQAMGFRFRVDELVVPMRLSTFNGGDPRNIVYLLTDEPQRIRLIPEEYVVRQISGEKLFDNVTKLLPIRIVGGGPRDVFRCTPWVVQSLPQRRNPHQHNGIAKELFAADLLAVATDKLSLSQEEREKQLLNINERLGLRGAAIDMLLAEEVADEKKRMVRKSLRALKDMTLTVVDGDFPREVLAKHNLKFEPFQMASSKNLRQGYDANLKGPTGKLEGKLYDSLGQAPSGKGPKRSTLGIATLIAGLLLVIRKTTARQAAGIVIAVALLGSSNGLHADETQLSLEEMIVRLAEPENAATMVDQIVAAAASKPATVVETLVETVRSTDNMVQQGWAIVTLSEIPALETDEALLSICNDTTQSQVVRTWAASARIALCKSTEAVMEKASLIDYYPAVARPISMRLAADLAEDGQVGVGELIQLSVRTPQLNTSLMPAILSQGVDALVEVMTQHNSQEVRRQSAGFLGSLAQQGKSEQVAQAVVKAYKFRLTADKVAWDGGPLFIPGIQWKKEPAQALVGNLIRWHVWLNQREDRESQQQITNNLYSIQLAKAAGYNMNRRNRRGQQDTSFWLGVWSEVVGKDGIRELLAEQGLEPSDFSDQSG